jgi:2-polyprenyl-6-hydroxyphenyl methylase/3-demethylubiquinone-9 3-methyltransferase
MRHDPGHQTAVASIVPGHARRNNLDLYDRHADDWWNDRSPFSRSLHEVNRVLLATIRARMGDRLKDMTVVDLGCGGGILAKPLACDGAWVVGLDTSLPSLFACRRHAADISRLGLVRGDVCIPPLAPAWADLVLCADVLEHIPDWRAVITAAAALLRPGGTLFAATINRTPWATWLAVTLGEGLGFIPRGTHDPTMFITPEELIAQARTLGLRSDGCFGLRPTLLRTLMDRRLRMTTSSAPSVLYGAWFVDGRLADGP